MPLNNQAIKDDPLDKCVSTDLVLRDSCKIGWNQSMAPYQLQ